MFRRTLITLFLVFTQGLVYGAAPDGKSEQEAFEASLHYRQGHIELPGGLASLEVPANFRYLDSDDSERLLVQGWGNPPGTHPLGMLFPANVSPLSSEGWGVVITYSDDGHVSDEDAGTIDYDQLLKDMIENTKEANQEREKQGYGTVDLLGWAEPPHYDQAAHKLYWAKKLQFGHSEAPTLNYSIRVLGRAGVLELNAVSSMDQIAAIRTSMQDVLAFTNFNGGNQYTDFNADTDKVATYGLAALIGGAVAAKAGLFAKLIALLIAGKKLVIVAFAGLAALLRKLFRRQQA